MACNALLILLVVANYFLQASGYIYSSGGTYSRWPNKTVPYIFNPGDYSSTDQALIQSAMAQITSDLGGCIIWQNLGLTGIPYPFLNFVIISRSGGNGVPAPTCYSYPGMITAQNGLGQHMSIQSGTNGCMGSVRSVMRILSYLLGLRPEHNKPNRASYITVNTAAVNSAALNAGVFAIISNSNTISYNANEFDYNSITMLDSLTYSATGAAVITSTTGRPVYNIGRLSVRDCQALTFLYTCSAFCQDLYGTGALPTQFTRTSTVATTLIIGVPIIGFTVTGSSSTTSNPISGLCSPNLVLDAAWNDGTTGRTFYVSGNLVYVVQNGQIVQNGVSLQTLFPQITAPLTAGYSAAGITYLVDATGNTFLYQNGAFVSQTQGSPANLAAAAGFGTSAANQANPLNVVNVFVDTNLNIYTIGISSSTPVPLSTVFAGNTALLNDINLFGIEAMYDFTDPAGVEKLAFIYAPTDGRPLQYFEGTPCSTTSLTNAQNQVCLTASAARPFTSTIAACTGTG